MTSILRALRRSGAALVAIAVCSCSSTEPRRTVPASTYVLTSFNGRAPAAITDSTAGEFGQIIADTLYFVENDSRVLRATVFRRVNTVFGFDETYRPRVLLDYRLRGDEIEIGAFTPCPDLCVRNDVGTYSAAGASITLTTYRYGNQPQVVFSRVERLE
jgi:hypothetical protein